jgi:hypothetical protein
MKKEDSHPLADDCQQPQRPSRSPAHYDQAKEKPLSARKYFACNEEEFSFERKPYF